RLAQQPRMPVRRPALVHDLRREQRIEVERLLAYGEEDVALPALELRRVVCDEPEEVALGMRRHWCAFAPLDRRRSAVRVESGDALPELVVDDLRLGDVLRVQLSP